MAKWQRASTTVCTQSPVSDFQRCSSRAPAPAPGPRSGLYSDVRRVALSRLVVDGVVSRCAYSVPHTLAGARVWVRVTSGEVVIIAGGGSEAREVARHLYVGPGQASIDDAHYPERCDPINRQPKATKPPRGTVPRSRRRSQALPGRGSCRHVADRLPTGALGRLPCLPINDIQ